jgi:putative endonuclease
MTFCVYILYSVSKQKRYIGQTSDIHVRLLKHNSGSNKSTKAGVPWQLLATLVMINRSEAIAVERKLKNLKSSKKQDEFILKNGFTMHEVIGPEK